MSGGSRKPLLDLIPAPQDTPSDLRAFVDPGEWLPCRDGRDRLAIDILIEVHGSIEIACERACDMSEPDFLVHLARTDPKLLAEGFKAIQLFQVFTLSTKVGQAIADQIDDIKPGQLVSLYPKLVELIPALTASKLAVHASQTNNYNFPGTSTPEDLIPEDIRAAMERLGMLGA